MGLVELDRRADAYKVIISPYILSTQTEMLKHTILETVSCGEEVFSRHGPTRQRRRAHRSDTSSASIIVIVFGAFVLLVELRRWWDASHCILPEDQVQFVCRRAIGVLKIHVGRGLCAHGE